MIAGSLEFAPGVADIITEENVMIIPEMKQLENRKWVFPKNEGATDFSETEYDTKEEAETAWRGWMAKQLAPSTGPKEALSGAEIARRRAIQQGGGIV